MKSTAEITEFDEIDTPFFFFELTKDLSEYLGRNPKLPHRHSYQEVIWVRQGTAEHFLDGNMVKSPPQTILIIPKGRIHCFVPSPDCLGSVIRFKDEFLSNLSYLLFSQVIEHTALKLTPQQATAIEAYFSLLNCEYKHADPYHFQALSHLLAAFVAKLEEFLMLHHDIRPEEVKQTICIWNRFNVLVEQKFKTEHTVSYYAAELGLSSRKLGKIVMLYTGKCASNVIDERLIMEAKRLILFSSSTLKEIAFELGFEEHSYFSKVFKRFTGKTPSSFKLNTKSV